MNRSKPSKPLAVAALISLAALTLAACGGGGTPTVTTAPAAHRTASKSSATVRVATTGLGRILVDSQGRTLYLFKADKGTKSTCFGACAVAWPPLRTSGKPTVGSGAKRALVGSTARSDGKPQVTYRGHPLYLYAGDQKAGDTSGQAINGFGAPWFVLTPGGNQISKKPSGRRGSASGY
jgi:predicted lipoprotein with Yx(FWY)xxD motif